MKCLIDIPKKKKYSYPILKYKSGESKMSKNNTQNSDVITSDEVKNEIQTTATTPKEEFIPFEIKVSQLSSPSMLHMVPGKLINLRQSLEGITRSSDLLADKAAKQVREVLDYLKSKKYFSSNEVKYTFDKTIFSTHFCGTSKLPDSTKNLSLLGNELVEFLETIQLCQDTMINMRKSLYPDIVKNVSDDNPLDEYLYIPETSSIFMSLSEDDKKVILERKKVLAEKLASQ